MQRGVATSALGRSAAVRERRSLRSGGDDHLGLSLIKPARLFPPSRVLGLRLACQTHRPRAGRQGDQHGADGAPPGGFSFISCQIGGQGTGRSPPSQSIPARKQPRPHGRRPIRKLPGGPAGWAFRKLNSQLLFQAPGLSMARAQSDASHTPPAQHWNVYPLSQTTPQRQFV